MASDVASRTTVKDGAVASMGHRGAQRIMDELKRLEKQRAKQGLAGIRVEHYRSPAANDKRSLSETLRLDKETYMSQMRAVEARFKKDWGRRKEIKGWLTKYKIARFEAINNLPHEAQET